MKLRNINFITLFLGFILSYYYYIHFILGQLNMYSFGKSVTWVLVFSTLAIPLTFLILKRSGNNLRILTLETFINRFKLNKSFMIFKVLITIYFFISLIFTLFYTISFDTIYFYNDFNIYIIGFALIIPIIIFSKKINKTTFLVVPFLVILLILYFIFYNVNPNPLYLYTLEWTKLNNYEELIKLIIIILPLYLEPFIFFYLCDLSNKEIKIKHMIFGIIFISIIPAYFYLRCGNEFGVLLTYIEYPFFECWRNIKLNEYIENADYLNTIIWVLLAVYRIMFSCMFINKIWNKKTRLIPIIISILSLMIALIFELDLFVYKEYQMTLLFISSSSLLISFFITIFYLFKAGGKNVKEKNS